MPSAITVDRRCSSGTVSFSSTVSAPIIRPKTSRTCSSVRVGATAAWVMINPFGYPVARKPCLPNFAYRAAVRTAARGEQLARRADLELRAESDLIRIVSCLTRVLPHAAPGPARPRGTHRLPAGRDTGFKPTDGDEESAWTSSGKC